MPRQGRRRGYFTQFNLCAPSESRQGHPDLREKKIATEEDNKKEKDTSEAVIRVMQNIIVATFLVSPVFW
jgi:hypothetical protein